MGATLRPSLETIQSILSSLQQSPLAQRVLLPDSDGYKSSLASYFSQQAQNLQPAIIVLPQSAGEVADTLKILAKHHKTTETGPLFAIRSGGKSPDAQSANIGSGITIDLSTLKHVRIASDRATAKIGPGARWGEVYTILANAGLTVPGGRDATVGVGGLTLGGGLSFFGPQNGMVCDSVVSFEVCLADGSIVEASQNSHPELWRALKGGSNNIGIVTSFEFKSFELGNIWGGQNVYPVSTASQHLDALYSLAADPSPDAYATVIQSFALYQGNVIINEGLRYMKPVESPPAFDKFLAIDGCMYSSNKITNMAATVDEQAGFNTNGRRQMFITTTFVNDREMLQYAFEAWNTSVPSVQHLPNVSWSMTLQPLPPVITQKGLESGGNVLGLDGAPPLIIAQIAISWDDAKDDGFLINKASGIFDDVAQTAKSRGLFHRYVYLNYAWPTQDPITGYGPENRAFLQSMSRKYDPMGLFQAGLAGGFKLFV